MENTAPISNGAYISCRMSEEDVKSIDDVVSSGRYMNRSDVIRTAIREFLAAHR